ncbi:hypothetical protein D3C81_1664160 [compost metagenome]
MTLGSKTSNLSACQVQVHATIQTLNTLQCQQGDFRHMHDKLALIHRAQVGLANAVAGLLQTQRFAVFGGAVVFAEMRSAMRARFLDLTMRSLQRPVSTQQCVVSLSGQVPSLYVAGWLPYR